MNRLLLFLIAVSCCAQIVLPTSCVANNGEPLNRFDDGLTFIVVGNFQPESGCTNGAGYVECPMAAGPQLSESDLLTNNPITLAPEPYASGSGCATSLTNANFRIFETATGYGVPYTVEMRPSGCRFIVDRDYTPNKTDMHDAFIASIK